MVGEKKKKTQLQKIIYGPGPIMKLLRFMGRRRTVGSHYLSGLFRYYLAFYDNNNPRMDQNGEEALLERLGAAQWRPSTIFDVGANTGDWTIVARQTNATAHLFEPIEALFPGLEQRFAGQPIVINKLALSDRQGTAQIEIDHGMFAVSSLHHGMGVFNGPKTLQDVQLTTGDAYCAENGIEDIDFLKIDVEGHDLAALRGFSRMLREDRVKLIQFEHNEMAIAPRVLVRDYYELLGDSYRIGKIMPRWVDFSPYKPSEERYLFANYLAVHRTVPIQIQSAIEGKPR